jgi:hypothetical protein
MQQVVSSCVVGARALMANRNGKVTIHNAAEGVAALCLSGAWVNATRNDPQNPLGFLPRSVGAPWRSMRADRNKPLPPG